MEGEPNHYTPIDGLILDDVLLIRKGIAHRDVRFDPKTDRLVVTEKRKAKRITHEFTVEQLQGIVGRFYRTVRPMWLVLLKHSGKLDEEKAELGITRVASASATP